MEKAYKIEPFFFLEYTWELYIACWKEHTILESELAKVAQPIIVFLCFALSKKDLLPPLVEHHRDVK